MKKVILDQAVLTEILRVNKEADSFCVVLSCSLVKLHENAELYTCLRSSREGIPCNLYIANHSETIAKHRGEMMEREWLEAIGDGESMSVSSFGRKPYAIESVCGQKPTAGCPDGQLLRRYLFVAGGRNHPQRRSRLWSQV